MPGHLEAWSLDKHYRFPTNQVAAVYGTPWPMLQKTRIQPRFDFFGGGGRHLGLFERVAYIVPPDFLRIIRAGSAGFRHRCCRGL